MIRHALTIDVEDWYHVENLRPVISRSRWGEMEPRLEANMDRLLALFDEAGVRATFFALGAAVERHPAVVRRIVEQGHELACHGWSHELVYRQERALFRQETRRAKAFLEDLAGGPVAGYRASTFSITERSLWALDEIAEAGFTYDSSIAPLRHDRYGIPSAPRHPHLRELDGGARLVEFPVSYLRLLGWRLPLGGGFFRLLPLSRFVSAFERYAARGESAALYLHPWELDPGQPRVAGLGRLRRWRHYVGLARCEERLRRLLAALPFAPMGELVRERFSAAS